MSTTAAKTKTSSKSKEDKENKDKTKEVKKICPVEGCNLKGIRRCSRCGSVYYCDAPHQKQHWKSHQLTCKARPTMLILDLVSEPTELPKPLKKSINLRAIHTTINSIEVAISRLDLTTPNQERPDSILIIAPIPSGMFGEELMISLIDFTQSGGRILVAAGLPSLPIATSESLIHSFGFNWKLATTTTASTHLFHPTHPLFPTFSPSMLETYSMTAFTLKGVGAEEVVFCNEEDKDKVGVAMGKIGGGYFGVIGDEKLIEDGSRRIIMALLGFPCN